MLWLVPINAPDIGECIYCGATDRPLGTEHAIPYALNGEWTLLRASCDDCARITSRFEREALRGLLPAIRNVLGMRTRRKKDRAKTLAVVLEAGGQQSTVELPPNDFPLYLPTPVFPAPGVVTGRPAMPYVQSNLRFIHIRGPSFEEFNKRHPGADFVGTRVTYAPDDFARGLAKIGYCFAVYTLGIAPLRDSPIRRVILGEDPCVGHWVGSWLDEPVNDAKGLHAARVKASVNGDDLHVVLRLFAQFGAPEYHIALGRVRPEYVQSPQWKFRPPSDRRPMPNENLDVGISTEGVKLAAIADDFGNEVSAFGLNVVAEKRETMSVKASIHWILPTAVVVWLTNKYVGTLVQEVAKEHYPKLKAAVLRLARRTTGPDREVKVSVVSSGPSKVEEQDPAVLSVWITLSDSRGVAFRFDQHLSTDELAAAVEALFALVFAHAQSENEESDLTKAPPAWPGSRSVPVVMRYDATTGCWQAWAFDRDGTAKPAGK
jgi:hypothetical protein